MLEKYVSEDLFFMSEEELREVCSWGSVGIHYAFNCYEESVHHILQLRDEVLNDYPNMTDKDMTVWKISRKESIRHAGYTTIFVQIPIDDYLQLRREHKIGIR